MMLNRRGTEDVSEFEQQAGPWIALTRVFVGLLLLYEAVVGGWWKVGTISSGPNPEWLGDEAGAAIVSTAEQAIEQGTYGWYATLLEAVVIPYAPLWSSLATLAQVAAGIALVLGLWTRPAAIIGLLYFLPVFHFGTIRTSPLFAVPIAFAFVANAGRYSGLDAILTRRSDAIGRATRLANATGVFPKRWYPGAAAALGAIAVYYYLSVPMMEETRIALVGLELAVFAGLTALGLVLVFRGRETIPVAADMIRIFVGYRFLHEIFVRVDPGLNALPGWASADAQAAVFEAIAATHVTPVSFVIETLVLPAIGVWVVVFAIVQTATGLALLVGWRTRLAGAVAVGYLLGLISLGFVRLAPLLLMGTIVAATIGGRYVSLDAVAGRDVTPPNLPAVLGAPALGVAVVFVSIGAVLGVEPGGYGETTGAIALVMLGIVAAAVAAGTGVDRLSTLESTDRLATSADD